MLPTNYLLTNHNMYKQDLALNNLQVPTDIWRQIETNLLCSAADYNLVSSAHLVFHSYNIFKTIKAPVH